MAFKEFSQFKIKNKYSWTYSVNIPSFFICPLLDYYSYSDKANQYDNNTFNNNQI